MTLAIYRHARAPLFWLAMAAVYVAAILPGSEAPTLGFADKADHFLAFITLTLLGRMAYVRWVPLLFATGLLAFGLLIEFSQGTSFIGRDASWMDAAVDMAGIVAGLLIASWLRKKQPALFE